MKFGEALEALRAGKYITRAQWSGDQFLFLAPPYIAHGDTLDQMFPQGVQVSPAILIKMAGWAVPWVPQHIDLLADDWTLVATPVIARVQPAVRPAAQPPPARPM